MEPNARAYFREMAQPGVFYIECIPKNKVLFIQTFIVWMHGRAYFNELEEGICDIPELLDDYKQYGEENFNVEIVVVGEEYWDPRKRKQVFDDSINSWEGDLYT